MLKLPELDDKTARQMVEEAVARIPTLTDQWTDFNEHDTGILLLETFAAFSEMQNFYLDQVGERFIERYLALAGLRRLPGEPLEDCAERFAADCRGVTRAVTARDYETLALAFQPEGGKAAQARAVCEDGRVRLTVHREPAPFTVRELAELRVWLEPYRLLTVRLETAAADYRPVRVRCRVELTGQGERVPECRRVIRAAVDRHVGAGGIGAEVNMEELRLELISLPFVKNVPMLELEAREQNVPFSAANGVLDEQLPLEEALAGDRLIGLGELDLELISS